MVGLAIEIIESKRFWALLLTVRVLLFGVGAKSVSMGTSFRALLILWSWGDFVMHGEQFDDVLVDQQKICYESNVWGCKSKNQFCYEKFGCKTAGDPRTSEDTRIYTLSLSFQGKLSEYFY